MDIIVWLIYIVGCWFDNGLVRELDKCLFIECFFFLIVENFVYCLFGIMGSDFILIECVLFDLKGDLLFLVEFEELEDMIEVVFVDYNG